MKRSVFFLFCVLLSGCLVGPNYRPPPLPSSDPWTSEKLPDVCDCDPPLIAWWEVFQDPLLCKYIEMAALNNNDILAAEANIWYARALKCIAVSELIPHFSADLNASRTYFSKNGPLFAAQAGGQDLTSPSSGIPFQIHLPRVQNLFNALIDATWEIDIFGKRHREVEAADARVGVAIAKRNDVLISILAEVAINYIELRSHQRRGVLLEDSIRILENRNFIIAKRFEDGYQNRLEYERAEAQLAEFKALLPAVYAQMYQNIYALSFLTGNPPETLVPELLPIQPLPSIPPKIAIGIRSDLLLRRPDVREAERALAEATANIGVAAASFFPTFTLIGDIGLQSLRLSNLFQAQSLTWAFGGDIYIPLYRGGKLVGTLRASEALAAAAAYTFQQTALAALREAESALIAFTEESLAAGELATAVDRYGNLFFLNSERHAKGLTNLIDVLNSEVDLNISQRNLLVSETAALVDLIVLYKALGGGWEPTEYIPLCGT